MPASASPVNPLPIGFKTSALVETDNLNLNASRKNLASIR